MTRARGPQTCGFLAHKFGHVMTRIARALALTCIVAFCCGWAPAGPSLLEHYDSVMMGISRSKIDAAEKFEKLEREYDRIFAIHDDQLRNMDNDGVLAMFRSANMMASYTMFFQTQKNPRFLAAMEAAFAELQRRGSPSAAVASDMIGAYVAARRFADANRIIAVSGAADLPRLPDKVQVQNFIRDRPGAYFIDPGSGQIGLTNFDTTTGDIIVIVAGCHFSRDAAEDIAATPSLRRAFGRTRTLWLSPADRQFDADQLRAWNEEFPEQPMLVAYSHAPWKGVDFSEIPNFYFYRDGRLIAQHAGWKKGAPPQPVLNALRQMRLLD